MEDGVLYTKIEDESTKDWNRERYTVTGRGSWGSEELWDPFLLLNELNGVDKVSSDSNRHLLNRGDGHHFVGLKDWYRRKLASKLEAPPKLKNLRKILSPSWNHSGAAVSMVFTSLSKRPVLTSSPVALKALIIVHRLLQQGPQDCLTSSYSRLGLLRDIASAGARGTQDPYWKFISSYAGTLVTKLTFHHRFPEFESSYSVEVSAVEGNRSSVVQALQRLQEGILSSLETGLVLLEETRGRGTSDSVERAVVPLLKEADLVYDITGFLLSSVQPTVTGDDSAEAVFKFEELHKVLRGLYERVRNETFTAPPPVLPEEPLWKPSSEVQRSRDNVKDGNSENEKDSQDLETSTMIAGGVGAAAAAAVERFTAAKKIFDTQRRQAAASADFCSSPIWNRKLDPPPNAATSTSRKPLKPQHTRMWSSFDDAAFFHNRSLAARLDMQASPVFYSPRDPSVPHSQLQPGFNFSIVNAPGEALIVADRVALQQQQAEHIQLQLEQMQLQIQQQQEQLYQLQLNRALKAVESTPTVSDDSSSCWQAGGSLSDLSAWQDFNINEEEDACPSSDEACTLDARDWEIVFSELHLGPKIGQGAFGDVIRGSWQGTDVAVKRLQNVLSSNFAQALVDFKREIQVVMKLRHPNIILFMGACTLPPEICIVMEYAANGSLFNVLHNPNVTIDMVTVVRWATEAARGMNYLHTRTPVVLHRDFKSVNLLVDGDWHIKVSDFGLAMTKQTSHAHSQVGTWGWMAPEVLESSPYDEKADVYSFGIVLWELITREEPFKGFHPMQIMRAIDRGERLQIPESSPGAYKSLIEDCWQTSPGNRPTFEEILHRLRLLQT